jgi:hypothetical protein
MGQGMIHRLITIFMHVASSLEVTCACKDMEGMAIMVHRVMSYRTRQFHTLEHVFGFLQDADPVTTLAAIFHDLIYYQVDDGLPDEVSGLLEPYLTHDGDGFVIQAALAGPDLAFQLVCSVFDRRPGDSLGTRSGLNEFLSALAMFKLLSPYFKTETLIAVTVCIEASIPFRGLDANGRTVGEALEERLKVLATNGVANLDQMAITRIIKRGIVFGNDDVRDFSLADPGHFLSKTWKLLPEANVSLRQKDIYSIADYRRALSGMRGFFAILDPALIYHAYRDLPTGETIGQWQAVAERNLRLAIDYLDAKLLAVAMLEAVAELSGGDAPIALFTGDLPVDDGEQEVLANHLPAMSRPTWLDETNPVYLLLKDGRVEASSFDLRNSPLALFMYLRIKPADLMVCIQAANRYFQRGMTAREFLAGFDGKLVADILHAIGSMVPTRKALLEQMSEQQSDTGS